MNLIMNCEEFKMKKNPNILKRVEQYKYKRGIHIIDTDSGIYTFMRVLTTIAFIFTMFCNGLYIMGQLINLSSGEKSSINMPAFIAISIGTAVIIIGYVLNCTRFKLWGALALIIPQITNYIYFHHAFNPNASTDGVVDTTSFILGMPIRFYVRHFIPAVIMLIAAIVMVIIDISARIKNNKIYYHILDDLYSKYKAGSREDMNEAEWEEFLSNYEPSKYQKQFTENEENTQQSESESSPSVDENE